MLSVVVQLDKSSASGPPIYASGQDPIFKVILKNNGTANCLVDVSHKGAVIAVTPVGSTTAVWTSANCPVNISSDVRALGPGDGFTGSMAWQREKSVSGCPSSPPIVDPGAYSVSVMASGVNSASVQFTLQ